MKKANTLVFDVGSTYTKVIAFNLSQTPRGEELTYLGRAQAPTTVQDIDLGLASAKAALEQNGIKEEAGAVYASCSAAGGLRMVAMGYMPRVTVKAAKEVAMNAGARVLEVLSCSEAREYREEVLQEIRPDIILLTGGTDGGNADAVLENAGIVVQAAEALRKAGGKPWEPIVIVAGNMESQSAAAAMLAANGLKYWRVPNILPSIHELKVKPAREAIHEQFIRQITRAPGLAKLLERVDGGKVAPTPGAVLLGAELLACGTKNTDGCGSLMIVDVGGATTDIHTIIPDLGALGIEELGLIISNEKQVAYRTVEGNLGMRVSACGVVETLGPRNVLRLGDGAELEKALGYRLHDALDAAQWQELEDKLRDFAERMEAAPETIVLEGAGLDAAFDTALATGAVAAAIRRHAGKLSEGNAVLGVSPGMPMGRDARTVERVIAVGGIFAHSSRERGLGIVRRAFANPLPHLLPTAPNFSFDREYLLFALGVLGEGHPEAVLQYAMEYFALEPQKAATDLRIRPLPI